MTVEARLAELGIALPELFPPARLYVGAVRTGDLPESVRRYAPRPANSMQSVAKSSRGGRCPTEPTRPALAAATFLGANRAKP